MTLRTLSRPCARSPGRPPSGGARAPKPSALALAVLLLALPAAVRAEACSSGPMPPLDAALPEYLPREVALPDAAAYVDAGGRVRIGGAEHVSYIVERLDALFATTHPGIGFAADLRGTTTALPLLTAGTTLFAPVGRGINGFERIAYKRAVGGAPLEIRVAHAANDTSQHLATSLAVYVNRENPIGEISMAALGRLLSIGNEGGDYSRWGQVGLKGAWAERPVHVYGTPAYSGFGDYMQDAHLQHRALAPQTTYHGTTGALLAALSRDPDGVTVAGIGRDDAHVKSLALTDARGGTATCGKPEEVVAGRYPLGRYLYFYLRRVPGQPLDALAVEYMRMVLSRQGQEIIASQSKGYLPLRADEVQAELAKLDGVAAGSETRRKTGKEARDEAGNDAREEAAPLVSKTRRQDAALRIVGGNGMADWMRGLRALYAGRHPEAQVRERMKGSATAMPALIAGVSDLGPMTRVAFVSERAGFRQERGHDVAEISVGYQGYAPRDQGNVPPAVYVNRRNPLRGMTIDTLDRVFTSGSADGDIALWSQLAAVPGPRTSTAVPATVPAECADRTIHIYGGRDDGGALTSLRRDAFHGHSFATRYEALDSDAAVLAAVADDVCGIGLTGWTDPRKGSAQLRILPLGTAPGDYHTPTYEAVAAGAYPLSPRLRIYFDHIPGHPLPGPVKDYLTLALSDEGQALLAKLKDNEGGFVPLSPADLAREREILRGM